MIEAFESACERLPTPKMYDLYILHLETLSHQTAQVKDKPKPSTEDEETEKEEKKEGEDMQTEETEAAEAKAEEQREEAKKMMKKVCEKAAKAKLLSDAGFAKWVLILLNGKPL